jgi:AAA+ superfamily predicted ATPase
MGASITLPERVRDYLCGIESADPLLEQRVRVLEGVPLNDGLDLLASKAAGLLSRSKRVQLIGPARSGRRAVAVAAFDRLGLGAVAVCADHRLEPVAGILARESVLDSFGVVIEPAEAADRSVLRLLTRRISAPVLVISDAPVEGFEDIPIIRLAPLESADRAAIWRQCVPDREDEDVAQVAEQFALGPGEISALSSQAEITKAGLWRTCGAIGSSDLETLATRIVPKRTWDDMVLMDETRSELRALADQIGGRPQVHGEWGYRRILGRATGVSALFAGPSGVGKTLAAEVIAHALNLDLYLVDLARVTSKYIGETEKNLRRIFEAAESSGAVLFFDEADALFGKRTEIKDSHDRYANGDISYLLSRMETYTGLAILATNLKSHLDAAFLRRLRLVVDFAQPTSDQRLQLWKKAIPETAPQDEIDWPWLARIELSGGNITTAAANAAFRAAAEKSPIGMVHLRAALKAELRKLDREPLEAYP